MNFITRTQVKQMAKERIDDMLDEYNSISKVAKLLNVNKGLVHRVKEGGYSETVNIALGLPVVKRVEMPVCLECGEIHDIKVTCDEVRKEQPKRRRKAADLDPGHWGMIQNYALDKLSEDFGFKRWTEFVVELAESYIDNMPPKEFEEVTLSLIPGREAEDNKNKTCC